MRKQCRHCPWKKSTDLDDIPAYSREQHRKMLGALRHRGGMETVQKLHLMACHETSEGKEKPCVGWLAYELGPGNNIGLRVASMMGRVEDFILDGPQVESPEETLWREDDA